MRDRTADARLADLAARIVSLEAEGAALRARARVLEAFATLRGRPHAAASMPSPSSSGGEDGGGAESSAPGAAAAAAAAAMAAAPGAAGFARPPHPPGTPGPGSAGTSSGGGGGGAGAGAGGTGPGPGEADAPLDWSAVAPLWGSITDRLREALPLAAGGGGEGGAAAAASTDAAAAAGEVATLVHEASALLASVALAEGDPYSGYRPGDAGGGEADGGLGAVVPTAAAALPHPLALADAIGLLPPQRAALVEARAAYLASMTSLVRGRAAIAAALHGLPDPVPWTGAPTARAFLHIAGAVEALGRHVRAGRIAATTFTGTAWRDVLSPPQAGALILLTSPARPCLLDMARELAVEAGVEEGGAGGGGVPADRDGREEEVDG